MARKFKKLFATLLALCVVVNPIAMQALAEDGGSESTPIDVLIEILPSADDTTVDVETQAGLEEEVEVETNSQETPNKDGSVTEEITQSAEGYVTESGMTVDYSGSSTITTAPDGTVTGSAETNYTSTYEDENVSYEAMGGSDVVIGESNIGDLLGEGEEVKVDVPLTDEDDPETEEIENESRVEGAQAGEIIDESGDKDDGDGEYNYTQTTVVEQGSVTVTTEDVTLNTGDPTKENDMEYTLSDATPSEDNHLLYAGATANQNPEDIEVPEATEGYDYVYIGGQTLSQFWTAFLYKTPGFEGEQPIFTDANGQSYYIRAKNYKNWVNSIDGFYVDGEKVTDDELYARWDSSEQFLLVDAKTGEMTTTYCADITTKAVDGYSYKMENIEDADYYTQEQAAMIRAIAENGYWGDTGEGNDIVSLRKKLAEVKDENGNYLFTEDELKLLTDGVAVTATQYAIWTYSNYMDDIAFVNTHYVPDNGADTTDRISTGAYGSDYIVNHIPDDQKAHADILFKFYDYLVNLDPTNSPEEKTTANTVITTENFIEDLNLTVVEKVQGHENNLDSNKDNDAYVTDLSFKLVVEVDPVTDDLRVVLLDGNNEQKAVGRIAGALQEGEVLLEEGDDGHYTFAGIVMTEGDQTFNITLDGLQNLDSGVYIYTSEVKNDRPSQTFVGMAGGKHAVNVNMSIRFELDVEDEIVVVEHYWREETVEPNTPPPERETPPPPERETPPPPARYRMSRRVTNLETIVDEEVPLAEVPQTGDISTVWFAMVLVALCGLCYLKLQEKRCKA